MVAHFKKNLEFTGGLAVHYQQSCVVGPDTYQHLARGETIGRRFHSAPVVRIADAMQMQLGHVALADGRWRFYAFAGEDTKAIDALAHWLETSPQSPIVRTRRHYEDIDAVFDLRAVFQETFDQIRYEDLPSLLRPRKGKFGLEDREKVFSTDHKGAGDIFDMRGIDRQKGCLIVVRPDQYIAHILPLDAFAELSGFFEPIFSDLA